MKLKVTADVWLSDATAKERSIGWGNYSKLKLKSIQEMAVIRFDTTPIQNREIISARLYFHAVEATHKLRYIRISTVTGNWQEGRFWMPDILGDGATYNYADQLTRKSWAWPGSQFCDVSFGSGNSFSNWAECRPETGGWLSVPVDIRLITAMKAGNTDGLAITDGGSIRPFNNYIYSHEDDLFGPYLELLLGGVQKIIPDTPQVSAEPDISSADQNFGAVALTISYSSDVFCWKIKVDGVPLGNWQIPNPEKGRPSRIVVPGLTPSKRYDFEITAVSISGHKSRPVRVSTVSSSPIQFPVKLEAARPTAGDPSQKVSSQDIGVWALPALVKLSPLGRRVIPAGGLKGEKVKKANSVWNGKAVHLFGICGEYVSFQLCVEKKGPKSEKFNIRSGVLQGAGGIERIETENIEVYKNWYAENSQGEWQPAYHIPITPTEDLIIPDPLRGLPEQANQTFTIDIYIPKKIQGGNYSGDITIRMNGGRPLAVIPIHLNVYSFEMPDDLAFLPEMNAYSIPENVHDFYRLAHQNRCVANFWCFRPELEITPSGIVVQWETYDKMVGPLLTGDAFKHNRRQRHPTELLYLPFIDSWPTQLSKKTYHYQGYWPKKGDSIQSLVDHYLTAPYIADALTQEYKDNFISVQKQFMEHFETNNWSKTELQFFFGGKKTHRTDYGTNMWWTTDEPYHLEDWMALTFFARLWQQGSKAVKNTDTPWAVRADISRPQWQGAWLSGLADVIYYSGFDNTRTVRRCTALKDNDGFALRAYGTANSDDADNLETIAMVLKAWLDGADGYQVWWAKGRASSLDRQEGCPGNALLVDGGRFGIPVVADMRLKAFRSAEQIIEYLVLLSRKYNLNRKQLKHLVLEVTPLEHHKLLPWQINGLRKEILRHL